MKLHFNLSFTTIGKYEICFINFNFIKKNVCFLPDGKIKLHKHCRQVESSDVFTPTIEASEPVYNFVTDV